MANTPVEVKKTAPTPALTLAPAPEAWRSFRTEMDRLLDRFSTGFGLPSLGSLFDAAPFRFETALSMPNPAIEIDVTLTDDTLTIKGEKKAETEEKDKNYYLSERSYGAFRRSFVLPDDVDRENVAAGFANGVLTVTLPKAAQARPEANKIEVKAAA